MKLPFAARRRADARHFPYTFVHRHIGERLAEDAIVDRP